MKHITREQLSAFMDDELDAGEAELLVRRLGGDFDLRGAAVRYGMIGHVIRDEMLRGDPRSLPERISGAIGDEAAPRPAVSGPRFLRPVAGAAVAASVAALAIFSISEPEQVGPGATSVTVPESPAVIMTPVAGPAAAIFRAGNPNQLSRYYLNHAEYATMLGGQGPLIRIVRAPEDPPEADDEAYPSDEARDDTVE